MGRKRGVATSSVVMAPPRQRSVRCARPSTRFRSKITSSSSVRKSSLRSRSVVVVAAQTLPISAPRTSSCCRCAGLSPVGLLLLAAAQFRFSTGQTAEAILPFAFQSACDQPVFRLHSPITALGPFRFVACAFYLQAPLRQCRIMVGMQLFNGEQCRFYGRGRDGLYESVGGVI